MVMRIGKDARTDLLVATRDHCFGGPGLSRIGERHNLEVSPWDLCRPLGLGKLARLPPSNEIDSLSRSREIFPLG